MAGFLLCRYKQSVKPWLPLAVVLVVLYAFLATIDALRRPAKVRGPGPFRLLSTIKALWRGRSAIVDGPCPFRRRDYLLSIAERSFFEVLRVTVGERFHVFAKVRLEDLLYLPKGTIGWQSWSNRVRQKHVDFVLCDRQWVSPLLVIELDDSTHIREVRRQRDVTVDSILSAAGLPILHLPAQRAYSTRALAELIAQKLATPSAPIAGQ